ncbi:MAG: hypothetical protein MJ189_01435 [Coriobacteriales bacterium]|nr:hypothetical protein [Coriobacteriales bacterium]
MSIAPNREHVIPDNLTIHDLLSVAPMSMSVDGQRVLLDGIDLLDIVENHETALYVYDENHIRHQLTQYVSCFKKEYENSSIVYAAKAFCSVVMDKIVAECGAGIDVAGGGELAIAKAASFPVERIFMQGNNKSHKEIAEAIDAHVACFVVDTIEELHKINDYAQIKGAVQKIILRICPGIEADTHSYIQTANEDSKFGFNIRNGAAYEAIKEALELENLELTGFHCHIGSQIFELSSYKEAIEVMFAFMEDVRRDFDFVARDLDLGGGLGIKYTIYDQNSSIEEYAHVITSAVKHCAARYDYPLPHLIVEPGRSILSNAGITLYTVGSVKTIP